MQRFHIMQFQSLQEAKTHKMPPLKKIEYWKI